MYDGMHLQLFKDRSDFIKLVEKIPKPIILGIHFWKTKTLSSRWEVIDILLKAKLNFFIKVVKYENHSNVMMNKETNVENVIIIINKESSRIEYQLDNWYIIYKDYEITIVKKLNDTFKLSEFFYFWYNYQSMYY